MIGMKFEVIYNVKEKVWYIYDEEGNCFKTEKLENIPIRIRDHIDLFREELRAMSIEAENEEDASS